MAKPRLNKYDAIIPDLPKLPPDDLARQDKINKVKETIDNRTPTNLAVMLIEARAYQDKIKDDLYVANLAVDAIEQLLEDSQQAGEDGWGAYGVKKNALRLPSGETIRVMPEPYGQVKDKEAFRLWCIANGYGDQLQLWPSRMNSIVKERLLNGEDTPDGTEAYVKTTVKVYKAGEVE